MNNVSLILFLTIFSTQALHVEVKNKSYSTLFSRTRTIKKKYYSFDQDFIGNIPHKLGMITEQLSADYPSTIINRAILYGPPGNGKSTLVKKIAEVSNRDLITISTPTLVGKYSGQAVETLTKLFMEIDKYLQEGRRLIIFFDEIDSIASHNDSEIKIQHTDALQALWLYLDKIKYEKNIFIVCATNSIDKLHTTFLDRFGNNLIEIKNPNLAKRKQILRYYFNQHTRGVYDSIINNIAKKTTGLSARTLQSFVEQVKTRAILEPNNQLTEGVVWDEFNYMQKKYGKILKNKNIEENLKKFLSASQTTLQVASIVMMIYQIATLIRAQKIGA